MKLSKQDYIDVLNFYTINFNKDLPIKILKKMTEKIIAEKLCRCIKKVPNKGFPESRAIGICNNSVVQKKKLGIYKFTCKKKKELKLKNNSYPNEDKIFKTVNGKLGLKSKKQINKTQKKNYLFK
tara:strand:+ start:1587 stop:1961 length:375 start_codon:yes stop_codon:yes gene_type:complete